MTTVTESVEVNAPVSRVYNQWTQFESFPRFMGGVDSVTQIDDTRNHWVTSIGGVTREFDTRIVVQHCDELIGWSSTDGTTHSGVVSFEALSGGRTRVTVELTWDPNGVVEKVGAALGFDDRQVRSDLARFTTFIEGRDGETGAWRGAVHPADRG